MLKEAYDIQYGLYNHDDPNLNHPFQHQMWTEKLSIKKDGLFQSYLRRYHTHQILKYFGLNFADFINLPIDKVEDMLIYTNVLAEMDRRAREEAESAANRQINSQYSQFEQNAVNSIVETGYTGF